MTFSNVPRRVVGRFAFLLILGLFCPLAVAQQTGVHWESDIETAKTRAATEGKALLLHFYGDQCPPCKLMERDVFPDARIIEKMNAEFVAVKINTSRHPQWVTEYGIRMMPTDVYLSPTGEEWHRRTGGANPANFLAEITTIANKLPKRQVPETQQIAQQMPVMQQQPQIMQQAQSYGMTPADYQQAAAQQQYAVQQAVVQQQGNGFADYALNAQPMNTQFANAQIMPAQDEQEGFAVSGKSNPQQVSPVFYQAQQQFAVAQMPDGTQQAVQPVAAQPPLVAGMTPDMMTATAVPGTQDQITQQTTMMQTTSPSMPVVTPGTVGGTFETDAIRKQPTIGLGAGTSLGIVAAVSGKPLSVQMPTVALDGYCAVSLSQQAKWLKGSPEITTEYDGVIFRFATLEARDAFAVNPELYAPVLRGNDAVELLTSRREVSGSRKFGAWYHGRVFLFSNVENYEKFQNNPELYAFQAQHPGNALAATRSMQRTAN